MGIFCTAIPAFEKTYLDSQPPVEHRSGGGLSQAYRSSVASAGFLDRADAQCRASVLGFFTKG